MILKKKEPIELTGKKYAFLFIQNVQKEISKFLEMFENNMKFPREACWINSNISNRDKNTTLMIFLFCHHCWSLLWSNYWRSLMLWNSTSWSRLKVALQIQLACVACKTTSINFKSYYDTAFALNTATNTVCFAQNFCIS